MNPTVLSVATRVPEARATRPVWLVGAGAALAAAAATELYGLAARAAGVPMSAGNIGAHTAEPLPVGAFATATLICAFWGTVLAVLLARFAARPARAYTWSAAALTALSLMGPLFAGDTAVSTKLTLAVGHLIAAAIIIPIVTRRLSRKHRPAAAPTRAEDARYATRHPKRAARRSGPTLLDREGGPDLVWRAASEPAALVPVAVPASQRGGPG